MNVPFPKQKADYPYMMYVHIKINKDTTIIGKWYSGLKHWEIVATLSARRNFMAKTNDI